MPDDLSKPDTTEPNDPSKPDTTEPDRQRIRFGLTAGSKVCVLIALGLVLTAAYFFWAPLSVPSANGPFMCQSAANPPDDDFAKGICSTVTDRCRLRAALTIAAAAVTSAVGLSMFGITRRTVLGPTEPTSAR